MKRLLLIFFMVLIFALSGCSENIADSGKVEQGETKDYIEVDEDTDPSTGDEIIEEELDFKKIKPNENGQIMVLMYHGIGDKESEWVRTAENFKKDLEILYTSGYRLLSLNDYVDNNIETDAGFTPVVLTFDDGLQNQFNYIEDNGSLIIDPDCAVGILEEFCATYPDFGKAASFFVYYPVPFRQKDLINDKYKFLIDNGYEIGNHGYNHENLGSITIEKVQESLAKNAKLTEDYISGYMVQSLALPYGAAPKGDNYKYVVSGEHEGYSYFNKAVLKVGSNPAVPPNHLKFDSSRIPRVRASEINVQGTGLYDYLDYFEKRPDKKYISDGKKDTITIPEYELPNINEDVIKDKKLITYKIDADENEN